MTLVPAAQPSDVQDSHDPEFDLLGKYWILAVDDDCLLVAFASDTNGKLKCIFWSVEGDQKKEETHCFRYIDSWCTDMYEVWRHNEPCSEFDKMMKRQEELALQEELSES
ncbi:uncharacterized protein LOC142591031 [Dermacentor variabilis]|uniref:uncharacterized protein LOC142591031 n=1 Tax=Dermacentor variabilis TaxID=34621 RepID=UPI003F5B8C79